MTATCEAMYTEALSVAQVCYRTSYYFITFYGHYGPCVGGVKSRVRALTVVDSVPRPSSIAPRRLLRATHIDDGPFRTSPSHAPRRL